MKELTDVSNLRLAIYGNLRLEIAQLCYPNKEGNLL